MRTLSVIRYPLSVSLALLAPFALSAQKNEMKLKHSETIQRTFPAPKTLDVDNISGSVHVIGYNGQQIEFTAVRTNEADTQEMLDKAAREVTLKTEEKDGELMIYPDGPFRDRNPPFRGSHNHDGNPGYRFTFEMTIKVPSSLNLNVRNINHGGITIEDVQGHFDIQEVNGKVEMKGIGGDGQVHSVNGAVNVAFKANPTGPCSFKTVNGAVEVSFPPGLAADLQYKTLHGGIYTDFDLNATPTSVTATAEQKNGHFVYRSHGYSSGRVGPGGPLLNFETVNGEVRILKK
jgi:hypothetical protein